MQIKGLQPKTQKMYLRAMPDFTRFPRRAPDSATPEELRAFQLDMKERGAGPAAFNNRLTVLSFFFATAPGDEAAHALSAGGEEVPRGAER
ncbi:phage integrase N-terminal SAM-like domain-containing protein [Leisingera sp. M523]|uniref:phage integrase N-terminal SAM-like domain-containing protein n=1 Tax=Leisingera sp. M523 TaxID=2867013 RepID=UPI0021A7A670|nr:phage integrase N-terminal SAM-like domain-containing protein [Leisingera sp. M523]